MNTFLSVCNKELRISKFKIIKYYDIKYSISIYKIMGKELKLQLRSRDKEILEN